jgi:hypothetical protein
MNEPDPEPIVVVSPLSRQVTWNGHKLELEIYRLEDESGWTLEVVNAEGTSTVWDDTFETDAAAEAEFRDTLKQEGVAAFRDVGNVLAFTRRPH